MSGGDGSALTWRNWPCTPLFVPENTLVLKLFDRFPRDLDHLAIVVDEFGGTEGNHPTTWSRRVGEVARTGRIEGREPRSSAAMMGSYLVDARVAVSGPCREPEVVIFRSELGENVDANTVAGLVLGAARHVPRTGDGGRLWAAGLKRGYGQSPHRQSDGESAGGGPPETVLGRGTPCLFWLMTLLLLLVPSAKTPTLMDGNEWAAPRRWNPSPASVEGKFAAEGRQAFWIWAHRHPDWCSFKHA